jgi:hypothetical protein
MKTSQKTKRILAWNGTECVIVSRETITTSSGELKKCCTIRIGHQFRFVAESDVRFIVVEV